MYLTILLMVVIGGLIGGFTNEIAIRMLFRPYKAKYIGKVRIPFTPGLIPKRRDEMAKQLGETVVSHLLTPEGLKRKFEDETFQSNIQKWVQKETNKLLSSQITIKEIAKKYLKVNNLEEKIDTYLTQMIEDIYEKVNQELETHTLENVVEGKIKVNIEKKTEQVALFISQKGAEFFSSYEGRKILLEMIESFTQERGFIRGVISVFMGKEKLAKQFQDEIIKSLKSESTKSNLKQIIQKEWIKVKNKPLKEVLPEMEKEKIKEYLKNQLNQKFQVENWLDKTIDELTENHKEAINNKYIPKILKRVTGYLTTKIEVIMNQVDLKDIVQKQVATFPVERLETIMLGIAKKELKMITYLGFLLGAIIGLLQSILMLFIK